jgi:hypothetical protein
VHHVGDENENALSDGSSDSLGYESPSISEKSSFEWYLPSMFSTPSALDREQLGASPLDWNFYNYRWQLKASTTGEGSSDGEPSSAASEADRSPVTHLDCDGDSNTPDPPAYPLGSFAGMTVESLNPSEDPPVVEEHEENDCSRNREEVATGAPRDRSAVLGATARSDFLYRKGGFFDRQRALKRRRHPVPIDRTEGTVETLSEAQNGSIGASISIPTVYEDDAHRGGCRSCCACSCHRRTSSDDTILSLDNNHDVCPSQDPSLREDLDKTRSELIAVLERVSSLERDFTDQIGVRKCFKWIVSKYRSPLQRSGAVCYPASGKSCVGSEKRSWWFAANRDGIVGAVGSGRVGNPAATLYVPTTCSRSCIQC